MLADCDEETYSALQAKHPAPHPNTYIPPPPPTPDFPELPAGVLMAAIRSFPNGSAGGPDKLKPQHLKDLVQDVKPGEVSPFLCALTSFCTLVLRGDVPDEVRPLFFGASLVALRKKTAGVRPIAVGCTLRRLVAKVASRMVRDEMEPLLSPKQLGYGVKGGAEAAVHAMRSFLSSLVVGRVVVKLDFQNAFNSIHRDKMLEATRDLAPEIFPFVHSSYSSPSHLLWGDRLILSAEGVQQGNPLGPLLFCLTLHQYCQRLSADLCVSYLDDVTIRGSCTDILQDLEVVQLAENLRRWKYITDPKCKLCSLPTPTTLHILNNCQTALVQGRYTWRYNSVLKQIVQKFRNVLSEGQALYADLPGFLANTSPPATIPLNLSSTSDRPDLVIISPDEIGILELTVCYNAPSNLEAAKKRKMDKYAALVADLESGSTLVTYVTLEIGCLGHYTKDAVKSLQLLLPSMTKREITTVLTSRSKIAISCSKSIFQAWDHPTWNSSTPLYSP